MKKLIIVVVLIVCFSFMFCSCSNKKDNDYLRIHIRANSNEECDQEVKLKVRDCVVSYLSEKVSTLATKEQAKDVVETELYNIVEIANKVLSSYGFDYKAKAYIKNEEFPTRIYDNLELTSGMYDALIIELGEGVGDNWWCVVFPPLCFVSKDSNNVEYKSLIVEIFEKIKEKCSK